VIGGYEPNPRKLDRWHSLGSRGALLRLDRFEQFWKAPSGASLPGSG